MATPATPTLLPDETIQKWVLILPLYLFQQEVLPQACQNIKCNQLFPSFPLVARYQKN